MLKNKKTLSAKLATISICLMLSIAASTFLISSVNAHDPAWEIPTYAYIIAAPNPVGVGQHVNVIMWLDLTFPSAAYTNDYRWHNYNLTITKPDGSIETEIFETCTDTTSAQYYGYTPDQTGNYTFTFSFPGQDHDEYGHSSSSAYVGDTYLSSSATTTLAVQEEPISTGISSYPLPTEYWTRPIYGENTDWWAISSNWLGSGSPQRNSLYVADAVGSQTSHVMWTKPLQAGGVVGGDSVTVQGDTYFEGSAYINRYSNPIIVNGKLYYTEPVSFSGSTAGPTDCVDLRTGELLWSRSDVPSLSFAMVMDVPPGNPNQHGVFPPVLFTSNFARAFDGDTGDPLFNCTNVPTGTSAMGPNGEVLRYVLSNAGNDTNPNWYLGQWNSSKIWYAGASGLSPSIVNATGSTATMSGGVLSGNIIVDAGINDQTNSKCRYDWNVSAAWRNSMTLTPTVIAARYGDIMICRNGTLPSMGLALSTVSYTPYTYFAVNLNETKGVVGSILWMKTYNPPSGNLTIFQGGYGFSERIFLESYKETGQWVAYSMDTGAKLWGPSISQTEINALDYYGNQFSGASIAQVAYGNVYTSEFGGILYCYDAKTGELNWCYGNGGEGNSTNAGYYSPRGNYPMFVANIGNGIVYLETTEHTVTTPIYKGATTRAINATDGTELWTLSAYTGGGASGAAYAIADGYTTYFNGYDNQIYVLGRGATSTTVSAPHIGLSLGTPLIISGSVTDLSSGTTQDEQATRFPNGVACASDESMTDWMSYVYQQRSLPTNFTGVTISIDVIDANGNYRNIGTAQTDSTGTYRLTWTPDISGDYTVLATFAGTNGYWPSYAEDGFTVMDTAAATVVPTTEPVSIADQYFVPAVTGLFIAIIIVMVLVLLGLRKRP
ncbi:MAG: PQQ-binding-like beta-propeller repeat protein [Candidatus Bathyarchaeota archaeon]|nr:PQQ-binding-like beta-propeller repeat protein [Candidatus Bathyarchaeota archaeon]